jgi:signal peptide peptidase SppA
MTIETTREFRPEGDLVLEPHAYGSSYARASAAAIQPGAVVVLPIRGPLMHHAESWFDSYEAILSRVDVALAAKPKALILSLHSPGGLVTGCFETAHAIRDRADRAGVPLIAYADGLATSGAYALACVADRIVVPATGIVGSIGVITAIMDVTEAAKRIGYRFEVITSGARKADGHPFKPISDDAIKAVKGRVDSLAEIFFEHVAKARELDVKAVRGFEAALFHGAEAVRVGLADEVGTLEQVIAAAAAKEGTTMDPKLIAAMLGLRSDATEADIRAALQESGITTTRLLSMTGQTSVGSALATCEAWRASHERVGQMSADLAAERSRRGDADAQTSIATAITAGRLQPAKRDVAERLYKEHGAAALNAFLEALPQVISPGSDPAKPPSGGGSTVSLTVEERAVASQLGISEADALENKKRYGAQAEG